MNPDAVYVNREIFKDPAIIPPWAPEDLLDRLHRAYPDDEELLRFLHEPQPSLGNVTGRRAIDQQRYRDLEALFKARM